MTWIISLLKGWGWKIMAGMGAVIAFLFMYLRLQHAQHKAETFKRKAQTEAEKARSNRAVAKARRKARKEKRRIEDEASKRHDSGDRPTGRFGDRM